MMKTLSGIKIVSLCLNVAGPAAAARLVALGASVVKVEPRDGDPLFHALPDFYHHLNQKQKVLTLDLKNKEQRTEFNQFLSEADVLLTSSESESLKRLGLDYDELKNQFPKLCCVAIVGHEDQTSPGADLTYQAQSGLITPPEMPRSCFADMAGALEVTSKVLELILNRERTGVARKAVVALAAATEFLTLPLRFGLTGLNKVLGGANPFYNIYETRDGWIALAALESHFQEKLKVGLEVSEISLKNLTKIFLTKTSSEWELIGKSLHIPLVEVRSEKSWK